MDDEVNPFSARLGWVVHKKKADDYVGRAAVEAGRGNGEIPTLVGLIMDGRHIARDGYSVQDDAGNPIGHVTSGTFSPILQKGVALARLTRSHSALGTTVYVVIRDKALPAIVSEAPFVPTI
jgi:aminomethyltransferase